MNRMSKRERLKSVNKNMKLNGLPKLSMAEMLDYEKFNLGYQLEAARLKRKRKLGVLMLSIIGVSLTVLYLVGGFDWLIIEIVNLLK